MTACLTWAGHTAAGLPWPTYEPSKVTTNHRHLVGLVRTDAKTRRRAPVGCCCPAANASRIALARPFLKDATILVLDEPTSAVDSGTEAAIMEASERPASSSSSGSAAPTPSTVT